MELKVIFVINSDLIQKNSRLTGMELKVVLVINSDLMQKTQLSCVNDSTRVNLIHSLSHSPNKYKKYSWQNNQLRKKDKLVIGMDDELRKDLLMVFHIVLQKMDILGLL